ncbi:MAG: hypothetical protein AABX83_00205 [Nanoarchaeota archaeon]
MINLSGIYSPLIIKEVNGKIKLSCDIYGKKETLAFDLLDNKPYVVDITIDAQEKCNRRILYSENCNRKIITAYLNYNFDADNLDLDTFGEMIELRGLIFYHVRNPAELEERHLDKIKEELLVRKNLEERAMNGYLRIVRCLEEKQEHFTRRAV